jgi:hypothetical protein
MADIICQKKVLAVEGKDEVEFFKALLKHVGITGFEISDVGGKDKFKTKFPALVRRTGFSDVEVLAVIRDADNDAEGAFKSIRDILRKEGFEPPEDHNRFSHSKPKIGIFIMPGNSDTGMLEDLCLETVKNHPAMDCVNTFIACVSHLDAAPGNLAKAKAQAFLAAMRNIVNSVGVAAQKHYWDFDSVALKEIKAFLKNLL